MKTPAYRLGCLTALFLLSAITLAQSPIPQDSAIMEQWIGTVAGARQWAGVGDQPTHTSLPIASDFTFDANGVLYAASSRSNQIFRLDSGGLVRVFAGTGEVSSTGNGGPKESATFREPRALAIDKAGNLLVAENGFIRRISPDGIVHPVAGNGEGFCPDGSGSLNGQIGVITRLAVAPNDAVYFIACSALYRLSASNYELLLQTGASSPGQVKPLPLEVPASQWRTGTVDDFDIHPNGDIYIADDRLKEVYVLTTQGIIRRIAGVVQGQGDPTKLGPLYVPFSSLRAIGILPNGDVFVPDRDSVFGVIRADGNYQRPESLFSLLIRTEGSGIRQSIAINRFVPTADGTMYLRSSDGIAYRISWEPALDLALGYLPTPTDDLTPSAVLQRFQPTRLRADAGGNLLVAGYLRSDASNRIYKVSPSGEVAHVAGTASGDQGYLFDSGPAREIAIPFPAEIETGPDGSLYFTSDFPQQGIARINLSGNLDFAIGRGSELAGLDLSGKVAKNLSFLGESSWTLPPGLLVSPAGEVYFRKRTPFGFDRRELIWKIGADGIVSLSVGGGGPLTADVDGVVATAISTELINRPLMDPAGTLYFQHQRSGDATARLYRVDAGGITRHFAGNGAAGPVVLGAMPRETPIDRCSTLSFLAPGDLLCRLANDVYRFREGQPVSLFLQAGSRLHNDGGRWKDDAYAAGMAERPLPGGAFAQLTYRLQDTAIRRTWPIPADCTYSVNVNALTVSALGQQASVSLSTGFQCPWSLGTSSFWLAPEGPLFGQGSATIRVNARPNSSTNPRTSELTVAGHHIPITQQGAAALAPALTLSPTSLDMPAAGGEAAVFVRFSGAAGWNATSAASWIQLPGGPSGIASAGMLVRTLPNSGANARSATITFRAGNSPLAAITVQQAGSVASGPVAKLNALVDGAGFRALPAAPGAIVSLFGENLAQNPALAQALPLPTTLSGIQLRIRAGSYQELAGLFYVSPTQVNLLVPDSAPLGPATIELLRDSAVAGSLSIVLERSMPSLFSANADGQGVPAGYTISVKNGVQRRGEIATCPPGQACVPIPVDYGEAGSEVFLVLFGTGFRGNPTPPRVSIGGFPAEVTYAGPQGAFAGLDQINIRIPNDVRGLGQLLVNVQQESKSANTLRMQF